MITRTTMGKICLAMTLLLAMCGTVVSAATVTQSIPYQGMLTDSSGNPLTGTYSVTFRLYDVATGGTALATDTHSVTTTQGLFTTTLTFGPQYFDGRALWLGIKVGSDAEMTPRQPLQPVPYALGLRPGANISGDASTNPSLKVINTGNDVAGLIVGTTGTNSPALFAGAGGKGSPAVFALSQNDVGVYGQGKEGGYFTPNQAGIVWPGNPGVNVSTTYDYNPGVRVYTSGDDSYGVIAVTEGDNSDGVYAYTGGPSSDGMHAMTTGPNSKGVYASSTQDVGVYGIGKTGGYFTTNQAGSFSEDKAAVNISTVYDFNPGIEITTEGIYSNGISMLNTGYHSDAVYISSESDVGAGVNVHMRKAESVGIHAVTYLDDSVGVFGMSEGADCTGVEAYSVGLRSDAVSAVARGSGGRGVYASSSYSEGVVGEARSAAGVKGYSQDKAGVWGVSDNDVGVYGETVNGTYGVFTNDKMYAGAGIDAPNVDVAEYMPVTEDFAPGTVLVIGDDGRLGVTSTTYDTRVAGIVSTEPGVSLGTNEDGNPGEAQVAIAGRVPCKVDASNGPIRPGDLLTTSDRPGYAMKAEPTMINGRGFYPDGTILGKALGTLEDDSGVIEVLVTLQ